MNKHVYIIFDRGNVWAFSNLTKLCKMFYNIGYYAIYYQLRKSSDITIDNYRIIKLKVV